MAKVFLYDIYSSAAKTGDMLFFNNQNPQVLANGSSGQVLQSNGFGLPPSWVSSSSSFITSVSNTSDINLSVLAGDLTADFANYNVSQFTNDSGYITSVGTAPTSLTTIGTSGAATLIANVLNIPQYTTPAMVLLSTATASNSATVDFTGLGSGSYVIYYTDVIPTTTSTTLNFRYGTGGTPTYQTSSYVYSISFNLNTGTSITTSNSTSASSFVLHGVTTGTGEGVSGVLTMLNPSGTSIYHPMTFAANDFNGGNNYYFTGGGCWKSTTAVTAGRFYFSSGNISSGTFKLYGIL